MRKIAYFFLCLLLSCSSKNEEKQILKVAIREEPLTLDPRKASDFTSSTILSLLYDGLTRCSGGSEFQLSLAEKVEVSEDKMTYLFYLKDAKWSDGKEITSKDFEESWKDSLSMNSPSSYLFYSILNAEDFAKGRKKREDVGITSLSEKVLQVKLKTPTPYFLSLTSFPLYLPTPSYASEKMKTSLFNGPFVLKRRDQGILLEKNPLFFDEKKVLLKQIQFQIIPDENTALNLFQKKEIDLLGGALLPLSLEKNGNFPRKSLPMAASSFCVFNLEALPFKNIRVRKAFFNAVQASNLFQNEIAEMGQTKAQNILPPSLNLLEKSSNLEDVNIDFKEVGKVTLLYRPNESEKKMALLLQKIWQESLGISVQIEQVEQKCLMQRLSGRDFQIAIAFWISQFDDPINILDRFRLKENAKNYASFESKDYQSILKQAENLEKEERLTVLKRAQEMLEEEAILIPLYHWNHPFLVQEYVGGLTTTSSGGILFDRFYLID